jgi:hypothetical protein
MDVSEGGTAAKRDRYRVDPTWFSGLTWTRPFFDLNYQVPTGNMVIYARNIGYIDFDSLEIAHQSIDGTPGPSCQSGGTAYITQAAFELYGTTSISVTNGFIHDWVTGHGGNAPNFLNYSAGAIFGAALVDHTEISDQNGWYGSGHAPINFGGACEGCGEVRFSKLHHGMAACFSVRSCHDNELYAITTSHQALDPCIHSQVVEDDGNEVDVVYNNVIHDNNPVGVTIYQCDASTIFNNVLWNNGNVQILLSGCSGAGSAAIANVYNNIVDCTGGGACFGTDAKGTLSGTVTSRTTSGSATAARSTSLRRSASRTNRTPSP